MKLARFLSAGTIEADLKSRDSRGVLAELAGLLVRENLIGSETDILSVLQNREELGSTGIGGGVAIPHVRLKNIGRIRMAVGRSGAGVEFNAVDGRPVHIFFLIVAPENSAGEHLKALARISRLLKKPRFRDALRKAEGPGEILKVIVTEDEKED